MCIAMCIPNVFENNKVAYNNFIFFLALELLNKKCFTSEVFFCYDDVLQSSDEFQAPEEEQFKELCPASDLRIIKSIRLSFLPVEVQNMIYRQLLDLFPDLVIIILYRDPRKVYLSS